MSIISGRKIIYGPHGPHISGGKSYVDRTDLIFLVEVHIWITSTTYFGIKSNSKPISHVQIPNLYSGKPIPKPYPPNPIPNLHRKNNPEPISQKPIPNPYPATHIPNPYPKPNPKPNPKTISQTQSQSQS